MSISDNLRQLRQEKGMTQSQAAEELGVTRQTVSSYESGRTRPDFDTLMRLAEIYGVSFEDVLLGNSRAFKRSRLVRITALLLYGAVSVLTFLQNAFLWAAFRFFPVSEGPISLDNTVATHFRLTSACETTERITLFVSSVGLLILLIMIAGFKMRLPVKTKLLYTALFSATLIVFSLVFALTDPVSTLKDHLLISVLVVVRILLAFIISVIIGIIQDRKAR